MKTKNVICKTKLFLFFSLSVCAMLASCKKQSPFPDADSTYYYSVCHCGVDDPLAELDWLHGMMVEFESLKGKTHSSISICTYDSVKDGFLINYNEYVADGQAGLYDCDGNLLCAIGGIAGNLCPEYNIDHSSIRKIYCNYADTVPTLFNKVWRIKHFVDREDWSRTVPTRNDGSTIPFALFFADDGRVYGSGVNQLQGTYNIYEHYINIDIQSATEMYDASGWEGRLLAALNNTTEFSFGNEGCTLRIYYDMNRKFIDFDLCSR